MTHIPTILIVDDEEIVRSALKHQLNDLGFRAIEAPSGMGVRELVERERPVLCLIDLVMPDREGVETITELRALENPPKLIAMSSSIEFLGVTMLLGADAILTKPIIQERLKTTLMQLLPD